MVSACAVIEFEFDVMQHCKSRPPWYYMFAVSNSAIGVGSTPSRLPWAQGFLSSSMAEAEIRELDMSLKLQYQKIAMGNQVLQKVRRRTN